MLQLSSQITAVKNGINFRDLGGIKNQQGQKIGSGLLFRSGDFFDITSAEKQIISEQLQLVNILDYRDHNEAQLRPNNLWPNSHYINLPANPFNQDVTATLTKALITNNLEKSSPNDFMIKLYQLLPFNNPAYHKLIELLLSGQSLVQHCAIGKDRTGVGVALTLFILGVDEKTIMDDYVLSDQFLANYKQKFFAEISHHLSDDELDKRLEIFLAKQIYLQSAFDAIKCKYQSIDNWLKKEYQLCEQKREIIQSYYLV